jgi:hypothetical protein
MSDHRENRVAGTNRETSAFAEFEIQDYVENPPLIHVLKVSADNAQATIVRLRRIERSVRRELDETRRQLSNELIRHEQTRGDSKESIARLEEVNSSLRNQLVELRRLSAVSVVIVWVGSALVAVGINLLTGDTDRAVGLAITIAGAAVEIAAFLFAGTRLEAGLEFEMLRMSRPRGSHSGPVIGVSAPCSPDQSMAWPGFSRGDSMVLLRSWGLLLVVCMARCRAAVWGEEEDASRPCWDFC